MKQITNTLSGFKQLLESAKTNGIYIRSAIINANDEVVKTNEFAPVSIVQSNSFALLRNGQPSWCEFDKAAKWDFDLPNGKAFKKYPDGKMMFEIQDPSFFF